MFLKYAEFRRVLEKRGSATCDNITTTDDNSEVLGEKKRSLLQVTILPHRWQFRSSWKKKEFATGDNITTTKGNFEGKKAIVNVSKPTIASFVDLVDMCAHNCCGYCCVLRLVDPVARLGHVIILKSKSDKSLSTGFSKLVSLSCFLQLLFTML
jgi:hypothetical protein